MPKFDDTIRQAVMRACEIAGSQAALCKKTGLSTSIMSRYLNGDVRYINPGTWKLLYPHIAPYLPERNLMDTESPFPVGTTVRLNSGGPLMTVDRIGDCMVECVWFRGKEALRESFAVAALLRDATGLAECIKNQIDNNNHKEE